ncbi:MAG: hypothetical protein B1H04_06245 [Planctomycetales bacterium 4484_123]|nr:MAG: hypothetical protein B1H04_06245 [Planctomycetales bacterium 4484_123]
MHVRCEHCGLDMEAPSGSVGKKIRCPQCFGIFVCRLPEAEVVREDGRAQGEPAEELVLEEELPEPLSDDQAIELTEGLEVADEPPVEPEVPAEAASPEEVLSDLGAGQPKRVVVENPRHWYVLVGGVAAVALTYDELKARAAAGVVKPKTRIYYAPKDVTLRARDVPGLFAEQGQPGQAGRVSPRPTRPSGGQVAAEASEVADALSSLGTNGAAAGPAPEPPEQQADPGGQGGDELGDAADALSRLAPEEQAPPEESKGPQQGPEGR